MIDWKCLLLSPGDSIRSAIERIDTTGAQIVLVTDDHGKLIGTVTDGDIRRGLLRGIALDDNVSGVMNTRPTTASPTEDRSAILALMKRRLLHHIPLVDDSGQVVGLETLDQLLQPARRESPVLLMAGGLGTRLRPLTNDLPKPMLMIGDKPILHSIIDNFAEYGFWKFYISVNYKSEIIEAYFRDGSQFGVQIEYVRETERLGTAGALGLLPETPRDPLIVMNADIVTRVNFVTLLGFHRQTNAAATFCLREFTTTVPYGVVRMRGTKLVEIEEKPVIRHLVNAGIYVIEPRCLGDIPTGEYLEMPTLLQELVARGDVVSGFPIHEHWLDIGRLEDLQKARDQYSSDNDR